jgi:hypothetical protein
MRRRSAATVFSPFSVTLPAAFDGDAADVEVTKRINRKRRDSRAMHAECPNGCGGTTLKGVCGSCG